MLRLDVMVRRPRAVLPRPREAIKAITVKLNASPMLAVHCISRVMLSLPVTVSQKMGLMSGLIWARGPERLVRY